MHYDVGKEYAERDFPSYSRSLDIRNREIFKATASSKQIMRQLLSLDQNQMLRGLFVDTFLCIRMVFIERHRYVFDYTVEGAVC